MEGTLRRIWWSVGRASQNQFPGTNFPYPIYDQFSGANFPYPSYDLTLFQTCLIISPLVQTNA